MSLLRQNKPQITQITQIFVTDHHDETDYHRFGHKRPSECSHRGVSHRNQYKSVRSVSPVPHEKICEICEICGSFKQNTLFLEFEGILDAGDLSLESQIYL